MDCKKFIDFIQFFYDFFKTKLSKQKHTGHSVMTGTCMEHRLRYVRSHTITLRSILHTLRWHTQMAQTVGLYPTPMTH